MTRREGNISVKAIRNPEMRVYVLVIVEFA